MCKRIVVDVVQIASPRSRCPDLIDACRGEHASRRKSLTADQRGAVALETLIAFFVLGTGLLLPLGDLAAAGFRFVSAWEALRALGQTIQYNPPADVTNWSSWKSALPTTVSGYPINNVQVVCSETMTACSAANSSAPMYYSYTTTVTIAPLVLRTAMCRSGNADPCSYVLSYSERFQ